MKQVIVCETAKFFLVAILISNFTCLTVFQNIVYAQAFDTTSPVLAHQPIKVAQRGKPLNIIAYIADSSEINRSLLRLKVGDKVIEGKFPQIDKQKVPVIIKIKSSGSFLLSGPGINYKRLAELPGGKKLFVTLQKDGFYRVYQDEDLNGYVPVQNSDILVDGNKYGVTIPSSMTDLPYLIYQIRVFDAFGNTGESELNKVRLLTENEIFELRNNRLADKGVAKMTQPGQKHSRPLYKKIWFWALVGITGGAVYYFTRDKKDTNNSTVDVLIEWN